MTLDTAYAEIDSLIKRFKDLSGPARKAINEDNTRKDFILPLFHALGWEIDNYAEVSAEEKVSRGFVDFAFRLNGVPRFFLETKRVSEDLTKPEWVRQTVDYAWTKGVTWALLSNFESLRVFNAEWRESNPLHAQFIEFDVDSYLTDFERLWWLSKPESAQNRLDREAEKVGKKTKRLPVSQHLFDDLKTWRQNLFRNMRQDTANARWSSGQIDEAILRILNRLIFIRTAEDRQVEPGRLRALVRELNARQRGRDLLPELRKLFREMNTVYDSELFAPHAADAVDCWPTPLEELIEGLYGSAYFQYNFNAIDADVLGAAYEQYLGHIVADPSTSLRAGPERSRRAGEVVEKRAKRKSQGIFYTPTFVVKYIVQQTVGKYLAEQGYSESHPPRILDMACGSGSFLIEAFDVLDRYVAVQRGQQHGQHDVLDHARQVEVLQRCLFGADKDKQAVDVARLNLMLKALNAREGLPKLQNIVHGDSLKMDWAQEFSEVMEEDGFDVIIGNPPYVRIQTLPKDDVIFFNGNYQAATGNYDICVLFVEQALRLLKPGGVLGFILPNKFMQADYGIGLRQVLASNQYVENIVDFKEFQVFEGATTYTCLLFLRKQTNARFSYIAAGNGLKDQTEARLELPLDVTAYLLQSTSLSDSPWHFSVGEGSELLERLRMIPAKLGDVADVFVGLQTSADDVFIMDFAGRGKRTLRLKSKALDTVVTLESDLLFPLVSGTDVKRYRTLPERQYILFPYKVDESSVELIDFKLIARKYPKIARYLSANKRRLGQREGGKLKGQNWYRFGRNQNIGIQGRIKICVPRLVEKLGAAFDAEGNHFLDNVDVGGVTLKEEYQQQGLKYLLALLNSKLLQWYFPFVSIPFRGGWWSANRQFLSQVPIRLVNFDDRADKHRHDRIVALVEEMLQLQTDHAAAERSLDDQRHALQRRIQQVDNKIDALVYQLYGLTDEEIKIVAGQ